MKLIVMLVLGGVGLSLYSMPSWARHDNSEANMQLFTLGGNDSQLTLKKSKLNDFDQCVENYVQWTKLSMEMIKSNCKKETRKKHPEKKNNDSASPKENKVSCTSSDDGLFVTCRGQLYKKDNGSSSEKLGAAMQQQLVPNKTIEKQKVDTVGAK